MYTRVTARGVPWQFPTSPCSYDRQKKDRDPARSLNMHMLLRLLITRRCKVVVACAESVDSLVLTRVQSCSY